MSRIQYVVQKPLPSDTVSIVCVGRMNSHVRHVRRSPASNFLVRVVSAPATPCGHAQHHDGLWRELRYLINISYLHICGVSVRKWQAWSRSYDSRQHCDGAVRHRTYEIHRQTPIHRSPSFVYNDIACGSNDSGWWMRVSLAISTNISVYSKGLQSCADNFMRVCRY